jgi:hypothetical protein
MPNAKANSNATECMCGDALLSLYLRLSLSLSLSLCICICTGSSLTTPPQWCCGARRRNRHPWLPVAREVKPIASRWRRRDPGRQRGREGGFKNVRSRPVVCVSGQFPQHQNIDWKRNLGMHHGTGQNLISQE